MEHESGWGVRWGWWGAVEAAGLGTRSFPLSESVSRSREPLPFRNGAWRLSQACKNGREHIMCVHLHLGDDHISDYFFGGLVLGCIEADFATKNAFFSIFRDLQIPSNSTFFSSAKFLNVTV